MILHVTNVANRVGGRSSVPRPCVEEAAKLATLTCGARLTAWPASARWPARARLSPPSRVTAMAAHVLEVSLDNRRLGETQLAPLVTAWRAGEYVHALTRIRSLWTVYFVPFNRQFTHAGLPRCVYLRKPRHRLLSSVPALCCTLVPRGTLGLSVRACYIVELRPITSYSRCAACRHRARVCACLPAAARPRLRLSSLHGIERYRHTGARVSCDCE